MSRRSVDESVPSLNTFRNNFWRNTRLGKCNTLRAPSDVLLFSKLKIDLEDRNIRRNVFFNILHTSKNRSK